MLCLQKKLNIKSLQVVATVLDLQKQGALASRSAPKADVAPSLAGGAALCRGQVHLATGADTHLKQVLFPGSLRRGRSRDSERETAEPDGTGV